MDLKISGNPKINRIANQILYLILLGTCIYLIANLEKADKTFATYSYKDFTGKIHENLTREQYLEMINASKRSFQINDETYLDIPEKPANVEFKIPECPEPTICPEIPEPTICPETHDKEFLNLRPDGGSPAVQTGYYKCKTDVLEIAGLKGSKFREAPSVQNKNILDLEESYFHFPKIRYNDHDGINITDTLWRVDHILDYYIITRKN